MSKKIPLWKQPHFIVRIREINAGSHILFHAECICGSFGRSRVANDRKHAIDYFYTKHKAVINRIKIRKAMEKNNAL